MLFHHIKDKAPKLTEIHNELASIREKLAASEKLNEYLRKQVEIYHITHGSVDQLLEMGQKLDLTKDELEQYKEKLAKIQSISDSLPTNRNANSFVPTANGVDNEANTTCRILVCFSCSCSELASSFFY